MKLIFSWCAECSGRRVAVFMAAAAVVVVVEPTLSVQLSPDKLRHQLDFLRAVSDAAHLSDPGVVSAAVRRYETCWLPLAAASSTSALSPPLDVHWVWHCHMLAPYRYQRDCVQV